MYAYSVINTYSNVLRYEAERLREEFASLGVTFEVKENRLGVEFPPADFVVFLDKDIRLATELEGKGYKLFNRAEAIRICDDKALTYTVLSGAEIKYPATLFAPLCYSDISKLDFKVAEEADLVAERLGFPVVLKPNVGSLGMGIKLIEGKRELISAMVEYARVPHHYQRYVSSSEGSDVRIIVVGGKAVAAMKRRNAEDFRSNIAVGGSAEKYDPSEGYIEVAEKAASALGLDYCGVDILAGKEDEPLLLEVNSNAFFRGMESVSGVNVAKLYAEYITATIIKNDFQTD